MDTKIVLALLMGNNVLVLALLLAHYKKNTDKAVEYHIYSQIALTLTIPLAILRFVFPLWIFAYLNSVLFFVSAYFEALALSSLTDSLSLKLKKALTISLALGIVVYSVSFMASRYPYGRVIVFSIINTSLLIYPSIKVLRTKDDSSLRALLGILFVVMLAGFVLRIIDAFRLGPLLVPLGPTLGESVMLFGVFAYTILGGVGIVLLSKEKIDKQLVKLAKYDRATNVFNRDGFIEELDFMTAKDVYENSSFAIMLFDIDGLAAINEKQGHQVGDAAIAHVANTLTEAVRGAGFVGRLGGDEFMVYYKVQSEKDLATVIRNCLSGIGENQPGDMPFSATIGAILLEFPAGRSIGYPYLYSICSLALHEAKENDQVKYVIVPY